MIINLPKNLERDTTHRYGSNSFKLHRLPMPRPGQVLGLVGVNGIGKSTALKVLAGKIKPNLGNFDSPPDWTEILTYFRGSELQNYFTKMLEDKIKAIMKPQYVDHIPKAVKGNVNDIISAKDQRGVKEKIIDDLQLRHILDRDIELLSGGELQRFAIGIVVVQKGQMYMFDEPSSYLDVRQRLKAALVIRSLVQDDSNPGEAANTYVLCVEHDLAVLDYLSDYICCLYGQPGVYGVVTMPFSVREGINVFLAGYIPTENLRFREFELSFKVAQTGLDSFEQKKARMDMYSYPSMSKILKSAGHEFRLKIDSGSFTESEIVVMLGENGTGKTTFIRMLAGLMKSDEEEAAEAAGDTEKAISLGVPKLNVSYKPQKIAPKFDGTVKGLLMSKINAAFIHPQFISDVSKPLNIEPLLDNEVKTLSGGELQRVAIVLCLGKPADIYLVDEPSAYLDSEQRIIAARVIKRYIMHAKKTAFIVEHDFIMSTYLADRVVVYSGSPGVDCRASTPKALLDGMNEFLSQLEITFRRDPSNYRPRINKKDSIKDQEQKKAGEFFFLDSTE
jgi:ATP-binding cassette subfamily E protein 1